MLHPGDLLEGKYRILGEIGRGGMSIVYLARNERANKTWAVKEVRRTEEAGGSLSAAGLAAETEMLRKLHHPNLPEIVDIIDGEESLLIVMDYIQGRDLQKIMDEKKAMDPSGHGALDPEAVSEWAVQLCDVLIYLHTRTPPIIYRDLKPANIMLQEDRTSASPFGSICVIDFGTARELKECGGGDTVSLGTRGYAAPEQFGGLGESDARTDIYNLGATMYHLLTGYSPAETDYAFLPLGELRPELGGTGLEKIVARCCEPSRENRYQSADELKYDLEHRRDLDDSVIREYGKKWKWFMTAVAAAAVTAAGMLFLGTARLRVVNTTYTAWISRAEAAESVPEGREAYLEAVCLNPRDPRAYQTLAGAVEEDHLVTAAERRVIEDCLGSTADGHMRSNAEILRKADPAVFDRLMYRLGTDYFFYYENRDGYTYAARRLSEISRPSALDRRRHEDSICRSLFLIADFCAGSRQNNADSSWIGQNDAEEVWMELAGYTSEPSEAVSRCGTRRIATAMYREQARQILLNADLYRDAGISEEQMKNALSTGREFLKKYAADKDDTHYDRQMSEETAQAIDAAQFRADHLFGEEESANARREGSARKE